MNEHKGRYRAYSNLFWNRYSVFSFYQIILVFLRCD